MTAVDAAPSGDAIADPEALLAVAERLLAGAGDDEQVEIAVSAGLSTSVRVFGGEVESFTSAAGQGVGVRLVREGRQGFASAGSLDADIVDRLLEEARDNARFSEVDEHAGVAEPDGVPFVDVDLWRDDILTTDPTDKIGLAASIEQLTREGDPRISGIRTASYGDAASAFALASTSGIRASARTTSASVSVQALADDTDGRTQTGYSYDAARSVAALDPAAAAARAVRSATDLLGAEKPASSTVSLVLEPRLAATVLGLVANTLTADRILKQRSPFVGREGEEIASPLVTLVDDPTDPASLGADVADGEGLACRRNALVTAGRLDGFLYDSYNGRKAGTGSTGSAVRGTRGLPSPGVQALHVLPGEAGDLDALIGGVDLGVLVFSLAGLHSGVNAVSGDFSVGVEGRMIRNGALAEPIAECTLGSTLQRLLLGVAAVGSDVEHLPSGVSTPAIRIDDVMLSGRT